MGNATSSNGNHNALHAAAKCGNLVEVQSLVGNFDINAKGEDDGTALYWVAREGHTDVFKLLLTYNPDVNIPNNDGNTALMIASRWGHTAIAVALSQHTDINVNHVNNSGWTALMIASRYGQTAIAVALSQRADINVNHVNNNGDTALMEASYNGRTAIAVTLSQYSDINVNHVNVSVSFLTSSHVVIGGEEGGRVRDGLLPLIIHRNPLYHNQPTVLSSLLLYYLILN